MESLFDLGPKRDPKYLYARDEELNTLVNNINNGRWVVLLGPRRVGKTSLAFCAARRANIPSIYVDAREDDDLKTALLNKLSSPVETTVSGNIGVPIPHPVSVGVSIGRRKQSLDIDNLLAREDKLLLIIDEAQWLRHPSGISKILAHIYDIHKRRVIIVITGSAVGVMQSVLNPGPKGAMFGRVLTITHIGKWKSPDVSLQFLEEGCKQNGISYSRIELEEAVRRLDGLPGWLTNFGNYYHEYGNLKKALDMTLNQALKVVGDELNSTSTLALGWERQMRILDAIAEGELPFSQIGDKVNLQDSVLDRNLKMLMRLEYIEKNEDGRYQVTDPVVKEYLMRIRRA